MFQIEIKNLKTKARIGISSEERKIYQSLLVTLRFKYQIKDKKKFDDINYLKNYSSIIKFVNIFIKKSQYRSLERLVFECSKVIEKKYKIKKVFISINKIDVAKRYKCESIIVKK